MNSKTILAITIAGTLLACKRELVLNQPQEEKKLRIDKRYAFVGGAPSTDYELFFEDQFATNNIEQGNNYWAPRTGSRTLYPGEPAEFTGYNTPASNTIANNMLAVNFTHSFNGLDTMYYGGGIISKKLFGYGYYETRIRVYNGSFGLHQSLWSAYGAVEIDGFEFDSKLTGLSPLHPGRHRWAPTHQMYTPTSAQKNNFVKVPNTGFNLPGGTLRDPDGVWSDDEGVWYTIGYEWLPDPLTGEAGVVNYYIDGVLNTTYDVTHSTQPGENYGVYNPANVYITALPFDAMRTISMVLPLTNAKMEVDYFRYYSKKFTNANQLGNAGFDYAKSTETSPLQGITSWNDYSFTNSSGYVYDGGDRLSAYCVKGADGNWIRSHYNQNANYTALTRQGLNFLKPGNYSLSFKFKCNAHNYSVSARTVKALVFDGAKNIIAQWVLPPSTNFLTFNTITLNNIVLPANSGSSYADATVLFYSDSNAAEYFHIDDVRFAAQ